MTALSERSRGEEIFVQAEANIPRCRKAPVQVTFHDVSGAPLSGLPVEITQKTQDFLFGNLLFDLIWEAHLYKPDLFKQRFLELFNFGILPFYWSTYERQPGRPNWQPMLPVLEWCKAYSVTPKGHPLVWPYNAGVPEWLYTMPEEAIEDLIHSRVMNLVSGYRDSIPIWDVTNEAVNHISWDEATSRDFAPRYHETSDWRGIPVAGAFKREIPIHEAADWVEKSLRWAYSANPAATLIVNDYNQEFQPNVRQRFYDLIRELLDRGAPVSGIGLQVHPVDHWIWPTELWDTLEMYAALHLPVHITELHQPDWDHPIEGGWREGRWNADLQAEFIAGLYRLAFGHPSVISINYWGLSERNIWIKGAGLIDSDYNPKPVFQALKNLIKSEWMTPQIQTKTDRNGEVQFSGFFGEYEVVIPKPGRQYDTRRIHVAQGQSNQWGLKVE